MVELQNGPATYTFPAASVTELVIVSLELPLRTFPHEKVWAKVFCIIPKNINVMSKKLNKRLFVFIMDKK